MASHVRGGRRAGVIYRFHPFMGSVNRRGGRQRIEKIGGWTARDAFNALFSTEYRKRTLLNCLLILISMIGLWAGSVYAPGAVTQVAVRERVQRRGCRADRFVGHHAAGDRNHLLPSYDAVYHKGPPARPPRSAGLLLSA